MEKNQQRAIITVVIITAFITTFTGSALNLSVPDIGDQFGVSAGTVGWLITGYTLAVAAFSWIFPCIDLCGAFSRPCYRRFSQL